MEIPQTGTSGAVVQSSPAQREAASVPAAPSAPAAAIVSSKPAEPQPDQVKKAVEEMQKFVADYATDLRFSVDKESGRMLVSVIDSRTQQVVRQIPTQDIINIARNIDRMQGLLFSGKA